MNGEPLTADALLPLVLSDGAEPQNSPAVPESDRVSSDVSEAEPIAEAQSASIAPDIRRRLVHQFEQWLDRAAKGEPPPQGLPAEIIEQAEQALATPAAQAAPDALGPDLLALASVLTALNGEVRLQGRAFRQLAEALSPLAQFSSRLERIEAAQELIAREIADRFEESAAAGPSSVEELPDDASERLMPSSADLLKVLFDLHDRLTRGLRNFNAAEARSSALRENQRRPGIFKRLFGSRGAERAPGDAPSAADALGEGYRLALSRLEAALQQWDIERIGTVGEMFDPGLMAVVDVQSSADAEDGTILEVFRSGYLLHDHVLATAQVKVAKSAGDQSGNSTEN